MFKYTRKYGYINTKGEVVIPPVFPGARMFSEFVAEVRQGNKMGYINKAGEFVLSPQFQAASPFREGFALVRKQDVICVISKQGSIVITDQEDDIDWLSKDGFNEGLLCAGKLNGAKVGQCGYLGHDGKWALRPDFGMVRPFRAGIAAFLDAKDTGMHGYIDKQGKIVIPPQFKEAYQFRNGVAFVTTPKLKAYLSRQGEYIFVDKKDEYAFLANFSDGLARVVMKKRVSERQSYVTGYINTGGKFCIEPQYYRGQDFSEGVAPVRRNHDSGWVYVDKSGKQVIEEEFYRAHPFSEGVAAVATKTGDYSLINRKGEYIVKGKFAFIGKMSEGMAIFTP